MKRTYLLLLILVASITANAQIKKGTRFLAGSCSFQTKSTNYDFSTPASPNNTSHTFNFGINILPTYQVFTRDNFAMTYGFSYNFVTSSESNNSQIGARSTHAMGLHTGFKKYTMFNAEVGVYYGMSANTTFPISKTPNGYKNYMLNLSLADVGVIYLLNQKFAIDAKGSIGNILINYGKTDGIKGSELTVGGGLRMPEVALGFMYYLR